MAEERQKRRRREGERRETDRQREERDGQTDREKRRERERLEVMKTFSFKLVDLASKENGVKFCPDCQTRLPQLSPEVMTGDAVDQETQGSVEGHEEAGA